MTKLQDINAIIAVRDRDLLLDTLWDDPDIVLRIRKKLEEVSIKNIKYYRAHFVGDINVNEIKGDDMNSQK